MKTKVRISENGKGQPIPTDKLRAMLKRMVSELKKRSKVGMPTITGMRVAIKLGLLEYEEDANNISINDFGQFAGIHQFVVGLPEKHSSLEIAIFFE